MNTNRFWIWICASWIYSCTHNHWRCSCIESIINYVHIFNGTCSEITDMLYNLKCFKKNWRLGECYMIILYFLRGRMMSPYKVQLLRFLKESIGCLFMCMCVCQLGFIQHEWVNVSRSQKRVLDTLKLKLKAALSQQI